MIYFNVINRYFTCYLIKQLNLNKGIHYDYSRNTTYQRFHFRSCVQ
nr:MAG TPA: hypothetical protein [Ackermannviridae sp.]